MLTAVSLAGCGAASRPPASAAHGPGSLGGCTDRWTGAAADRDYGNPGNWSGGRAPGAGDFGCIQPGAVVNVTRAPLEPAAGLITEGTLCLDVPVQTLAQSIYNGPPPGQPALPQIPGTTDPATVPSSSPAQTAPSMPPAQTTPRTQLVD